MPGEGTCYMYIQPYTPGARRVSPPPGPGKEYRPDVCQPAVPASCPLDCIEQPDEAPREELGLDVVVGEALPRGADSGSVVVALAVREARELELLLLRSHLALLLT